MSSRALRPFLFILPWLLFQARSQEVTVRTGAMVCEHFDGWGVKADFAAIPVGARRQLLQALGATTYKLPLSFRLLPPDGDGVDLDSTRYGNLLFGVKLVAEKRDADYVLEVDSPPPNFKKFITSRGHVELNPNGLLQEAEGAYINFLAEVIKSLKRDSQRSPAGLIFQAEPNRYWGNAACPISAPQLHRLYELFSGDGHTTPVVGPSCIGFEESLFYLSGDISEKKRGSLSDIFGYAGGRGRGGDVLAGAHLIDMPKWMTGWCLYDSSSETETAIHVLAEIVHDIGKIGARRWIWNEGYSPDPTLYALYFGDGTETSLGKTLRFLFNAAPRGSRVNQLDFLVADSVRSTLNGLRFTNDGDDCILVVNSSDSGYGLRFDNLDAAPDSIWLSWSSDTSMLNLKTGKADVPTVSIPAGGAFMLRLGSRKVTNSMQSVTPSQSDFKFGDNR